MKQASAGFRPAAVTITFLVTYVYWREFEPSVRYKILDTVQPGVLIPRVETNYLASPPVCSDILQNLTVGKWMRRSNFSGLVSTWKDDAKVEAEIDKHLTNFRIRRGIHTKLWREDGECGYRSLQDKPKNHSWGGAVGAWCDAKSSKPCCSNGEGGTCGMECNCSNCVDIRKVLHAEVSDWIPDDSRCNKRDYTAEESCNILKNFPTLHFIGESFSRKMARAMILTLRSDQFKGVQLDSHDELLTNTCVGYDAIYWKNCKLPHGNLRNHLKDKRPFCVTHSFEMSYQAFYIPTHADEFFQLVVNVTAQPGNVILLGVGLHMQCRFDATVKYMNPVVQHLKNYYNVTTLRKSKDGPSIWPHIIYMNPDLPGILKPPVFRDSQGKERCSKFADEMKRYCSFHGIAMLDFRPLTTGVHSYDGTHYGLGVNLMKAQFLLNYLDSLVNS